MLAPTDLANAAQNLFATTAIDVPARSETLVLLPVKAAPSSSWRLWHHEMEPAPAARAPLFGPQFTTSPPSHFISRLWLAQGARLIGQRGLIDAQGALFLDGPVQQEADLATALRLCRSGNESIMLRTDGKLAGQLLADLPLGQRRLTGTGLHLGAALGENTASFPLREAAVLLMVARTRAKIDYVVVKQLSAELRDLLAETGFGAARVFAVEQLQGVICEEIMMPVLPPFGAGWIDEASVQRLRGLAAGFRSVLAGGPRIERRPFFLTSSAGEHGPAAQIAQRQGYELRVLEGRPMTEQALVVARADRIATDGLMGLQALLLTTRDVPVLDLAGGDQAARLPLIQSLGNPYAFAAPDQATQALSQFASLPVADPA